MNTAAILDPTRVVPLRSGETIQVHELPWLDSLKFLQMLGEKAGAIGQKIFADPVVAESARAGDRSAVVERVILHLSEIIAQSTELVAFLVERSLAPEDQARIAKFKATDGLRVFRAALELVLNDDLVAEGNAIAVALSRVLTTAPKTMATLSSDGSGSNPSSSGRDIDPMRPAPTPSASSSSTPASSPTV